MRKLAMGGIRTFALYLAVFLAFPVVAQDSPLEPGFCKGVLKALQTDKTPTVVVGLDDQGNLVSALFMSRAEKECTKVTPRKVDFFPLKTSAVYRIQPFAHVTLSGSQCHFIGYDPSGQAIWYCHSH